MKQEDIDPLLLLILMGPIGSIAGVASLLRSGNELNKRAFATAFLNSGLIATASSATAFGYFGECEIWVSVAAGIVAGLGGGKLIDVVISIALGATKAIAQRIGGTK